MKRVLWLTGLCWALFAGWVTGQSDDASLLDLRRQAEAGDALAQTILAVRYLNGDRVVMDHAEAVRWCRLAAEQGHPGAQFYLGTMYARGAGVSKDDAEAVRWFRRAAEKGDVGAQFNLGVMFAEGTGVTKDVAEALRWYRIAAENGDASAQSNLGFMLNNNGLAADDADAVRWFRRAAEQGDAVAQFNLGLMYLKGEGVAKDGVEAYRWFLLAGAQGHRDSRHNVQVLEARLLTPNQRAEGQRLARTFLPRQEVGGGSAKRDTSIQPSTRSGTGFLITAAGHIVTNHHVIDAAGEIRVLTAVGLKPATRIAVDAAADVALLKIETDAYEPVPIISSHTVGLGQTVLTVGFPNVGIQGFSPKLAKGEIAGLAGLRDRPRDFQVSVPLQPGNSGGALVDERGNVVGVVVAKLSAKAALETTGSLPENVNYAVKSSYLLSFLESVPELAAHLPPPHDGAPDYAAAVRKAEGAAVLVLVGNPSQVPFPFRGSWTPHPPGAQPVGYDDGRVVVGEHEVRAEEWSGDVVSVWQQAPGEIKIVIDGWAEGDRYRMNERWLLSSDGQMMTVTSVNDSTPSQILYRLRAPASGPTGNTGP